jgi:hypothetical protein
MSALGTPEPEHKTSEKPPNRRRHASHSFYDFKLSHWVTAFLTAALVVGSGVQIAIYNKQVAIMKGQNVISTQQTYIANAQRDIYDRQAGIMQTQADLAKAQNDIAKDTLIDANRAWLTPTKVDIVRQIDDPNGPNFSVHFQNVGRLPALDAKAVAFWTPITLKTPMQKGHDLPDSDELQTIYSQIKSSCWAGHTVYGYGVIFPSNIVDVQTPVAGPFIVRIQFNRANIISGTELTVIRGCFIYRTFDLIRHASFCRYLTNARTGAVGWEILDCLGGNYAD